MVIRLIYKTILFLYPINKQLGEKPCKNNIYVSNTYYKIPRNMSSKYCFKAYIDKIVQALKDTPHDKLIMETYALFVNEEAFFLKCQLSSKGSKDSMQTPIKITIEFVVKFAKLILKCF